MDSGNALAKLPTRTGQFDYNFFVNELTSITTEDLYPALENRWVLGIMAVNAVSTWVGAVGHNEFATFDQDGSEEIDPVFPYMLKYTPNATLSALAEENPELTVYEYMQTIPKGTLLYTV